MLRCSGFGHRFFEKQGLIDHAPKPTFSRTRALATYCLHFRRFQTLKLAPRQVATRVAASCPSRGEDLPALHKKTSPLKNGEVCQSRK